ncbi:hypothetical protein H5410_035246 [Solanum commersonii]|uniref:Carboxypeptidase A inhibitor-like domain-containing protein n=1 Tax=Solanum commersonii TaxID=4109 RepID=A0A9J5Y4J4_SOLCO|nr:hypothetical protein H5410_035246 [Solanum commersonii]
MAQDAILPMTTKLFEANRDPICNKPCKTNDDCSEGSFCQTCWDFTEKCAPYIGDPVANMGL